MKQMTRKELERLLPKVQLVPIKEIKENPENPRTITEADFNKAVRSIESFWEMLFLRPLILDDQNMVLGGNVRLLAGRKAGFDFMPCIVATALSDQQRAEFIIKDNLPFGDWDFDKIANDWDMQLLDDWGFKAPGWKDPTQQVSFTAKGKEPVYDIIFPAPTELKRQQLIKKLSDAGFKLDVDYILPD